MSQYGLSKMKVLGKIASLLCLFFFECSDSSNRDNNRIIKNFNKVDWCTSTCGKTNIVCEMNHTCPTNDSKSWYTQSLDANLVLELHNNLRQYFASGQEKVAGFVHVANMIALSWDDELEYASLCNVMSDTLPKGTHDKCRNTLKFPHHVAQMIWMSDIKQEESCIVGIKDEIQNWYREIHISNADRILGDSQSFHFNPITKHFSQLVWAETRKIGCTLAKKIKENESPACLLVCNYAPGGNRFGKSMFRLGKPCSKCPRGYKCNDTNSALCQRPAAGDYEEYEDEESQTEIGAATNLRSSNISIYLRVIFSAILNICSQFAK